MTERRASAGRIGLLALALGGIAGAAIWLLSSTDDARPPGSRDRSDTSSRANADREPGDVSSPTSGFQRRSATVRVPRTPEAAAAARAATPAPPRDPEAANERPAPTMSESEIEEALAPDAPRHLKLLAARELVRQEDFERVQRLTADLLSAAPSDADALRLGVLAACVLGDGERAREHASRLFPGQRASLQKRCDEVGIGLDP